MLSCLCVFCGSWLVPWDSRGLTLGSPAISPADFFQGKHFFLYGEFPGDERRTLSRYVTAFNGSVSGDRGGRGGGVVGRGEKGLREDGEGRTPRLGTGCGVPCQTCSRRWAALDA